MSQEVVTLVSKDEESFVVEKDVAMMSTSIKNMIEGAQKAAPALYLCIIEYCKYHTDAEKVTEEKPAAPASEIKAWDTEFVKVDHGTLFEIILGANYLDIKSLLDLTCLTVSSMIKGKSPEEIRNTFNIKSEFTPEEELAARRENPWAFE